MANNLMLSVSEDFNIEAFADTLAEQYQSKGFQVRVTKMKNGARIIFDKNCGGINMILGMGQGITANCTLQANNKGENLLSVNFSDSEWTGKIIGAVVGWFICFLPVITAIIGTLKQISLPKDIGNDIEMIVNTQQ